MLEVSGLRKSYRDLVAVDGVSFRAGKGETIGLLGPKPLEIKQIIGDARSSHLLRLIHLAARI